MNQVPASTQWTLDAAGDTGRSAVDSVYMIVCPHTGSKGSGFLLGNGLIITNEHVVRGCSECQIIAISAYQEQIKIIQMWLDADKDLAILRPAQALTGGVELADSDSLEVGQSMMTWGFPLGYNGPTPLLSVGYLAGFIAHETGAGQKKHLIVNGAFNSGNSGGALFRASDNRVVGIVVSKHAPISHYHQQAIDALAHNSSGVVYTATNDKGERNSFVESQIVAELLTHMKSLTQVMIGEAIAVEELNKMLEEIDLTPPVDLPRNAPCHCGSEKRFKECHGRHV